MLATLLKHETLKFFNKLSCKTAVENKDGPGSKVGIQFQISLKYSGVLIDIGL